ncbi:MAG: BON domain-containing protein [Candidatus Sulfotelmatobacter sp.]
MTVGNLLKAAGSMLAVGVLGATMFTQAGFAQTASAARYDNQIQTTVAQKLSAKKQFANVQSSVEDGIVTLTGTVDLYQRKLDAAKFARKAQNVAGVRNLITVAGPNVPDAQLQNKLATKLRYVRVGYDNMFDNFALGVKDGVVTVTGQTLNPVGRDDALAEVQNMPGVKDVVADITVLPASLFDNRVRLQAARAIYGSSVLNKYAIDPARPIRIIVDNGHLTLYGTVDNKMDKEIAGIRAGSVFGAFSVNNQLTVDRM